MKPWRRSVAAAMLGAVLMALMLAGSGVAAAHATRIATDPADGAALAHGPGRVAATFNERLQTAFSAMTVVGPDGNLWSAGEPSISGAVISVGVLPLGPTGRYTVNYRVTSADGHVVSGLWGFTLTVAGTGKPGPAASQPDGGGIPVWPFLLAGAVIVGAGGWWAARRRT